MNPRLFREHRAHRGDLEWRVVLRHPPRGRVGPFWRLDRDAEVCRDETVMHRAPQGRRTEHRRRDLLASEARLEHPHGAEGSAPSSFDVQRDQRQAHAGQAEPGEAARARLARASLDGDRRDEGRRGRVVVRHAEATWVGGEACRRVIVPGQVHIAKDTGREAKARSGAARRPAGRTWSRRRRASPSARDRPSPPGERASGRAHEGRAVARDRPRAELGSPLAALVACRLARQHDRVTPYGRRRRWRDEQVTELPPGRVEQA